MNKAAHNGLQVSHTFVPPSLLPTPLPTVFLPEAPLFRHRQPPSAGATNALRLTFTLLVLLWALPQELRGQSLAEAARKERNRRARLPGAAVTYTNEALHAQAGRFGVSSSDRATPATSRRRALPVRSSLRTDPGGAWLEPALSPGQGQAGGRRTASPGTAGQAGRSEPQAPGRSLPPDHRHRPGSCLWSADRPGGAPTRPEPAGPLGRPAGTGRPARAAAPERENPGPGRIPGPPWLPVSLGRPLMERRAPCSGIEPGGDGN